MESKVIHRDRQELQSADMNNAQDFAQASLDHMVIDAIEPGKAYSGFAATKTGAAEITMTSGRLYYGGAVYARPSSVVIDVLALLPLVSKKRIAIVASGQTVETDVQPRDFLIDVVEGTTEPSSVAMRKDRYANVAAVAGTEAPDPAYPAVDQTYTILAYALLDTGGVVSIEQHAPTKVANLRTVDTRTGALEAWRGGVSGRVDTLQTDLSALASKMPGFAPLSEMSDLAAQLDQLRTHIFEPASHLVYNTDHLLDVATSQTGHGSYDAILEDGIRFPAAASATSALSLLDPNNAYVTKTGDFIMPKFGHAIRMDLTGYDAETRLSQYTYETKDVVLRHRSRRRCRYGPLRRIMANTAWWRAGNVHYHPRIFRRDAETWDVAVETTKDYLQTGAIVYNGFANWLRLPFFWVDTVLEPYWDKVTTTHSETGQQVAQTFLNSQDGWMSQLGLFFSRKAASGDVTVLICETQFGMPDITKTISRTTLSHGDIIAGEAAAGGGLPSLTETKVAITPTYLEAGRRYAVVLITAGDHYVAMTNSDNAVVQGTFFSSTDGAFFSGNLVSDMKMRLYFARFERTRVSVEMNALQLAGGVADIDILAETITPPACRMDYEVQIAGAWVALDADGAGPDLSGLPAILPLRVTFTGTTDLMPGIELSGSQVKVTRADTAMTWLGQQRALGSAAGTIKVIADLAGFDDTPHDCTISLLTGAAQDGTEAADVVSDTVLIDGTIRRTATFTGLTASYYTVKIVGASASAVSNFQVAELIDYAQT